MDSDDLVGAQEIADRLGLSHAENVHNWRKRHADFPQPIAKLTRAWIWVWGDVEEWIRKTGRAEMLKVPEPPPSPPRRPTKRK